MEMRTVLDVGLRVRALRQQQQLSQAELARRLGVSRAWVVRLEQGSPRLEAQHVLDSLVALGSPLVSVDTVNAPLADVTDDPFRSAFGGMQD